MPTATEGGNQQHLSDVVVTEVPVTFRPRSSGGGPAPLAGPPLPAHRPPGATPGFHVMAKPSGAICNLDCSYCFYLDKESLYPGDRFRMGEGLLDNYLRQLVEAHTASVVTIAWQGGEPTLMGLGFFEKAVEIAKRYKRPGQRLQHTIQTNVTLLTSAWAQFLAKNDFLVGVSIDGPPPLHDVYRVDKQGRPTYAKVARGLEHLRSNRVEYNILCTVHAANASHPREVYRFLRDDCGAAFIQFIPIVEHVPTEDDPEAVSERSVSAGSWGSFLTGVFDEWVVRDVGKVFVQAFDAALASWSGQPPGVCVFAETCGHAVALEHNGDVYSCDHFVDAGHLLGNIRDSHLVELVASSQQLSFGAAKREALPSCCTACDVRFACWGECPKRRFIAAPDGEPGLNYLCLGYREFFHHVDGPMRLMAGLLAQRRSPAHVMGILTKAPRNSACPCGSGRKAKSCHGAAC